MKYSDWIILLWITHSAEILKLALFCGVAAAIGYFRLREKIHKGWILFALSIFSALLFWDSFRPTPAPKDFQFEASQLVPEAVTAIDLIQRSDESYKALTTYSVLGESIYIQNGKQQFMSTVRISYANPNKLRIEGKVATGFPYKLIKNGDSVRTSPFEEDPSSTPRKRLEDFVVGNTGISGGAVTYVPGHLMNIRWGRLFTGNVPFDSKRWKFDGKGTLDDRTVYQISEVYSEPSKSRQTVWLDSESFLISQVKLETESGAIFHIRYSDESLGVDLDDKLFDVGEIRLTIPYRKTNGHP